MLTKEDIEVIKVIVRDAIAEALAPIKAEIAGMKADITGIKQDVSSMKRDIGRLYDRTDNVLGFMNIESRGIEHEINRAVLPYIQSKFEAYVIRPFEVKELTFIQSNSTLTELDGAFVADSKEMPSVHIAMSKFFIIIEAKHYVTFERINHKFEQIYKLMEYFQAAKDFMAHGSEGKHYSRKFMQHVRRYSLDKIDKVCLYIGGPVWEQGSVTYLKDVMGGKTTRFQNYVRPDRILLTEEQQLTVLAYMKEHIGIIVPHGTRYNITDIDTLSGGAAGCNIRKRKQGGSVQSLEIPNGPEMVIMPNYINTVFT